MAAQETSTSFMPEGHELERFEKKAQQYFLQDYEQGLAGTESTAEAVPPDITSHLLEYDITGARVRAAGQATGGFLREVAENEAALSWVIQDAVSLYLLDRVAAGGDPFYLSQLDTIISGSQGWVRFTKLIQAGLLELIGSEVRATERGVTELRRLNSYCERLKREYV